MEKKVAIFGDSVMRGIIIDGEKKSYAVSKGIDWEAIERDLGVKLDNRSRMGATVTYGLNKLCECLDAGNTYYAAVIEYGGNDCDFNWEEVAADGEKTHLSKTAGHVFEETLNKIIDKLVENNIKPILMNLPPISSLRYFKWFTRKGLNEENIMRHLGDIETISRNQEFYNNIVVKTAYARGVDLVDVRRRFLRRKDYFSLICEDGIHPDVLGEQLIAQAFIDKYAAR